MFGKFRKHFSKVWKKSFQGLEKPIPKVPNLGKTASARREAL